MKEVVILNGVRAQVGKYMGPLNQLKPMIWQQ